MRAIARAFILSIVCSAAAAEIVTTTDGRVFELRRDGTYKQMQNERSDSNAYRNVDIVDLHLQMDKWTGKKVKVRGSLSVPTQGTSFVLLFQRPDMTGISISVDMGRVPTSRIAEIIKICAVICVEAEVVGTVQRPGKQLTDFIVDDVKIIKAKREFE